MSGSRLHINWIKKWLCLTAIAFATVCGSYAQTKDDGTALSASGMDEGNRKVFSGTVSSPNGDPLPYATIYFRHNPTVGSISNAEGNFTIPADCSMDDTLMVSLISYELYSIPVKAITGGKPLDITLIEMPIMLNEAIVIAYPKETRRQQRKEMRALLDKIYARLPIDYPLTENSYDVVSDIMILNEGQVLTFDNMVGTLIELPRKGKGGSDSLRIEVEKYSNYMDSDIKKGIETFDIASLNKQEKKAVSWATKDKEYEKTLPHRLLWKIDARRLFLQCYDQEKYWSKREKDFSTLILSYHRVYSFMGIIEADMELTMEVDNGLYTINNVSHRTTVKANIPFGYKLSDAELAVLNICNLQGEMLEKYKAKKIDAMVEGNVLLNNVHGRMVPSEKNMVSDLDMTDTKGIRAAFSYKSTVKVLGFKL